MPPPGTVLQVDTKITDVFAKKIKDTSADTGIQLGAGGDGVGAHMITDENYWWRCGNIDTQPGKHYAIITIREDATIGHIGESLFSRYERPYFVMDEDGWIWSNFPDDCWKDDAPNPADPAVKILQILFEKNKADTWVVSDVIMPTGA